jgi:hypothetical protein
VFLLTNVLDARRLSVKRAGRIYRQRWAIEVFYRTFKRTMGVAKLRSASGKRARVELNWALAAITVTGLLAVPAILAARVNPSRYSPAGALRILRNAIFDRTIRPGPDPGRDLIRRLAHAVTDGYQRKSKKRSRHRIITRNTPKPRRSKPPILTRATDHLRTKALERLRQIIR